jgi:UDP-N-acetylmuramate--alanine ligase
MKYFLVGIKGSGMAALAHILKDKGHEVIGSDVDQYVFTEDSLNERNIKIYSFDKYDLKDIDLVIAGHNFYPFSSEVQKALKLGKSVIEYHKFVATLVDSKYSIAICGSHGKTSSVGLLCELMKDYNPSFLRGDGVGRWTNSKYFIFEACEYKEHFLVYKPNEIIILNVDYDHNDYFENELKYKQAFIDFSKRAKTKVYVLDSCKFINYKTQYFGDTSFKIFNDNSLMFNNKKIPGIDLNVISNEFKNNRLGVILCALNNGVKPSLLNKYIKDFKGVKRRSQEIIIKDDIFVDDYAHHPSQMRVIIEEYRNKYPSKRIIAIFKPDRYSRILYFHKQINKSLSTADEAFVLPFPKMMKNDTNELFDESIIGISVLDDALLLEKLKDYTNCVFLFLSSKDLSEIRNQLMSFKFDID